MPVDYHKGLLQAHSSKLALLQRVVDAFLIVLGLYIACHSYPKEWSERETFAATLGVIAFLLTATANGLYRPWRGAWMRQELLGILGTWFVVVSVLLFVAFFTKSTAEHSRAISLTWFITSPVLIVLWRAILRFALQELRRRGRNSRTVGVAGVTPIAERLAEQIASDPRAGLRIIGFYDDRGPERRPSVPDPHADVKGDLDQLLADARAGALDIIYITLPLRAEQRIHTILASLADTTATVYLVPDFFVFNALHARWGNVGDIPVVSIFDTPFSGVDGWLKRVEDLVLGSVILGLIALPMMLIAVLVKLTSRGPVFFKQTRYGLNGKEIKVLKFRTMSVCEDGSDVRQATRNDPRVTKLGAVLRRTSLDELPQFLNVLRGDMSIVGPRPHAVAHNEMYRSKIHGYMLRHKVKPGITGWAQVNGWRGETDVVEKMERRIEHDLAYINNWNLFWDLRIIFLTVFGVIKRDNAY